MAKDISPDEVATMLAALNQAYHAQFSGMSGAPQEAQKGLRSCLKWFQEHRIAVCLVGGAKPHYEIVMVPRNDVVR